MLLPEKEKYIRYRVIVILLVGINLHAILTVFCALSLSSICPGKRVLTDMIIYWILANLSISHKL